LGYSKRVSLLMGMDSFIVLFSIFIGYYILNPYFSIYSLEMIM